MDSAAPLILAALTLALPGPTNALLAVAGATTGIKSSLGLIVAVLAGYTVSITILAAVSAPLAAFVPRFDVFLRLLAALALTYTALQLWSSSNRTENRARASLGWSDVFLVTVTNPKGLILYVLAFAPKQTSGGAIVASVGELFLLIILMSCGWLLAGASLGAAVPHATKLIARAGSLVLIAFALTFFAGVIFYDQRQPLFRAPAPMTSPTEAVSPVR